MAAVWFADVVGYTRLATQDEDAALAVVDELQSLSRSAARDRGRIVKFTGDGVLAVFDSTSNALRAAKELEEAFADAEVVRRHGCSLSIGVHLGEVVEAADGDLYGDGVNVASRIEGLAGSRQILMSEDVYRQVRNRTAFVTAPFGEHEVKGLDEPMALYVLEEGPGAEAPSVAEEAPEASVDDQARGGGAPTLKAEPAPADAAPTVELPGDWQALPVGTVLNERYEVESLLGRGGFGATYCASDRGRFGAPCAVKEFAPHVTDDPSGLARFEREALALVELRHHGIPRLHEFFQDRGRHFLVQDLAEGEDLSTIVKQKGPLSEADTVSILSQLLDILQYLHAQDPPVVHRDVKPANIILSDDGRVQLVDFGAVRDARPENPTVSAIYTPGYAPLQQLMGKVAPSVDLFAAGATAAFLLTGASPKHLYDIESDSLRVRGKTGASERLEVFIEELTDGRAETHGSATEAKRALLQSVGADAPTEEADATVVLPAGAAGALGTSAGTRPGTAGKPAGGAPGSRSAARARPRRGRGMYILGVGAVIGVAALVVTVMSEPQEDGDGDAAPSTGTVLDDASPGPSADPGETGPVPPSVPADASTTAPDGASAAAGGASTSPIAEALQIDATARASTEAGLLVQIRHPVTWPIVSQPTDGHVAVRDPATGAMFLAGIDVVSGLDVQPRTFVERWAATTIAPYAQVAIASAEPPTGESSAYRLDVVQGSQAVREGVVVVTPFTEVDAGRTLFRWWATLNQSNATAATLQAIAESVEVLLDGD